MMCFLGLHCAYLFFLTALFSTGGANARYLEASAEIIHRLGTQTTEKALRNWPKLANALCPLGESGLVDDLFRFADLRQALKLETSQGQKDERSSINSGDGRYFSMSAAIPSKRPGMTDSQMAEMEERYRNQRFREFDAVFETNLSISFAPGTNDQKAVISDLNISTQLISTAAPMPTTGASDEVLYQWAINDQTFDWAPLAVGVEDIIKEVKSGRCELGGKPEDGTNSHPQWNVNTAGGNLEIWDTRSEEFGAQN